MRTQRKPAAPRFGLLAFAIYATHDAAIKSLGGTYSPFQIVFFVVLLSFPMVTLMLVRDTRAENLRPRDPLWAAVRTAAVVIGGFCAFYAFAVLPLAETYAILFAAPLMITVLSVPLLGEVVRFHRWMAVLVGLAGVIVVLRPGSADLGLGHLAALVAAFGSALAGVVMRKIGSTERREVLLLYPLLANFAVMLCILPFVYEPMPLADLGMVLLIAFLAIVAMSLMIRAYTLADAAIVAPMQYSQIIWATLFGWLFFGETSDALTFVGAGIIIASGAYIVLREAGGDASKHRPVLNTLSRRPEMGAMPRISLIVRKSALRAREQLPRKQH
ncbi:EamA family transporter [Sulfitobacter alexandrii]|uniref:EamA family transporter n=1 Tax=Sulfitobacter alexandrii TaxID=1917485 RepID=A0A1J0WCT4_9RHOB|nr:DMT family transporter [Sulfitobacter alexandrii]APE42108.1 EamA family transporter [Sulfitobacter alexandrii]